MDRPQLFLTGVFLTEHLGEANGVVDRGTPSRGLKGKLDVSFLVAIRNRRQLEEISRYDELDPPQGRPLLRMIRPICDSLSNRSPSTMDISSMMSVFVRSQRSLAFGFRLTFFTSDCASSFPSPIPAKL